MTNHKDEAEELLAGASPSSVDPDFAHWYLARAQVHATLALAEAQSATALIAAIEKWGGESDSWPYVIREALGLNEKEASDV